jgi:hypothetical protein
MKEAVAETGSLTASVCSGHQDIKEGRGVAYVIVIAGPHRGEVKHARDGMLVIGRGVIASNALNLGNDEFVSRADAASKRPGHAIVKNVEQKWRLVDCGSTNKTWVILAEKFNYIAMGAFVSLRPAFLFGCGMSSVLFLDITQEPPTSLRKALCVVEGEPPAHVSDAPSPTKLIATTETNPTPASDEYTALTQWKGVVRVLNEQGLGHLLR